MLLPPYRACWKSCPPNFELLSVSQRGRKNGGAHDSEGRCGEKSIWELGTHVGNRFTKSSRSQWSFPKAENVFIVNDTNFCTIFIHVLITSSEVSQSLAIENDFYDPKRIGFFIAISSDSVNSMPGSLNFTRSYHNQLNWYRSDNWRWIDRK